MLTKDNSIPLEHNTPLHLLICHYFISVAGEYSAWINVNDITFISLRLFCDVHLVSPGFNIANVMHANLSTKALAAILASSYIFVEIIRESSKLYKVGTYPY